MARLGAKVEEARASRSLQADHGPRLPVADEADLACRALAAAERIVGRKAVRAARD